MERFRQIAKDEADMAELLNPEDPEPNAEGAWGILTWQRRWRARTADRKNRAILRSRIAALALALLVPAAFFDHFWAPLAVAVGAILWYAFWTVYGCDAELRSAGECAD